MKKLFLSLIALSVLTTELAQASRFGRGRRPDAVAQQKSALVRGSAVPAYRSDVVAQDVLVQADDESEVEDGTKSLAVQTTGGGIGHIYSNISLAGRRFSFQIEEVALNSENKPVIRGWMCRVGSSSNRSSNISIISDTDSVARIGSEYMSDTGIRSEYCGNSANDTKKSFELEIFVRGIDDELNFVLTHHNDNYSDPNNRYKSFTVEIGTLRQILGSEIEAVYAAIASEAPVMTMTQQVSSTDVITLEINSYETYSRLVTSSYPYTLITNLTMCAEKNNEQGVASACLANPNAWNTPKMNFDYIPSETCALANMSTQSSDLMCAVIASELYKSYLQKRFRPVDFGMTPGTYTVYYKSSYGHIVSAEVEVVP